VVWVRLSDGTVYYGIPKYFSEDSFVLPELILTDTWIWTPDSEAPEEIGRPVYIAGSSIAAIETGDTWAELRAAPGAGSKRTAR
jgi:cbb3-type cytochrome oxidase subunit 1